MTVDRPALPVYVRPRPMTADEWPADWVWLTWADVPEATRITAAEALGEAVAELGLPADRAYTCAFWRDLSFPPPGTPVAALTLWGLAQPPDSVFVNVDVPDVRRLVRHEVYHLHAASLDPDRTPGPDEEVRAERFAATGAT